MIGRDEIEVPQLVDLRDGGQIARFKRQVKLLRELGVKEYTDVSGRKIVLFEHAGAIDTTGDPEGS